MPDGAARLERAFTAAGRPVFMPYVMGGYPDLAASVRHARILGRHAAVIELGVPFSDPLADGPTIQAAGQRALAAGTTPDDVLGVAAELRDGPPIAVMTYYNTVLARGADAFLARAADAGVAGLIIPDLPVDEAGPVRAIAHQRGVALVALAAPTTGEERLEEIGRHAEGFVYCVAVTGVTGGEVAVDDRLTGFLARARARIRVPLAVGFGVRTPEQAVAIGRHADGVVIASELIRRIDEAPDPAAADAEVAAFSTAVDRALTASA
jgi:tryptophan synthase alpha chain